MAEVGVRRLVAWQCFLFAHAAVTKALGAELEAEHGMPLTWYDVLVNLDEAEDNRLRMHELAERVVLSQSGISRLVDRMQQAGLVERVRCDEDARVTWAELTGEGLQALQEAAPTHLAGIKAHFADHLDGAEVEAMISALTRVLDVHDSPRRPRESSHPA